MCGRYSLATPPETLAERFDVRVPHDLEPRYNCAPGQALPVITAPDRMERLEWGLVPRPTTTRGRRSTPAPRPSRRSPRSRRPSSAAGVWSRPTGSTSGPRADVPTAFADDRPFAMAGIWERWTPPTAQAELDDFGSGVEPRETFAIVTCDPNELVADLHDRMAVVLDRAAERRWLEAPLAEALDLLDPGRRAPRVPRLAGRQRRLERLARPDRTGRRVTRRVDWEEGVFRRLPLGFERTIVVCTGILREQGYALTSTAGKRS